MTNIPSQFLARLKLILLGAKCLLFENHSSTIIGRVTSLPVPMVDGFILLLANSGYANGEIAAQNMKLIC